MHHAVTLFLFFLSFIYDIHNLAYLHHKYRESIHTNSFAITFYFTQYWMDGKYYKIRLHNIIIHQTILEKKIH